MMLNFREKSSSRDAEQIRVSLRTEKYTTSSTSPDYFGSNIKHGEILQSSIKAVKFMARETYVTKPFDRTIALRCLSGGDALTSLMCCQ